MKYAAALAVVASLVSAAAAAEVYRCPKADGGVEYRDFPCRDAKEQRKLEPTLSTVAPPAKKPDLDKQQAELDSRMKQRAADEEADRARRRAFAERCRGDEDNIIRQRAWLGAYSPALRQSAANEIFIQERKMRDAGC